MHQNDFNYEVCSRGDFENASWNVEDILSTVWKTEYWNLWNLIYLVLNIYKRWTLFIGKQQKISRVWKWMSWREWKLSYYS